MNDCIGSMASRKYLGMIIFFGILQLPWENTNGEMKRLTCNDSSASNLTSPGYPHNYGYDLDIMWNVTAPSNKEIAILFKDFNTEKLDDVLGIHDPEGAFNSRNYSGTGLNFPPFLSTGSYLLVTFQSDHNEDYSGFHLALHCFDKSERTKNVRLKSGMKINEGILEVFGGPLIRDQWIPVCTESLNSYLAEITCRQLGFPGVYQFTNETDIQYKETSCASIVCYKSNFLLQQCVWNMTQEEPSKASRLQCFNFAYRGCYPLAKNIELYLRSNDTDVDDCIHTCSMTSSELAAITGDGCYCFNVSQSRIHTEYPDDSLCARTGSNIHGGDGSRIWAFHYNATIGFCEHPGDIDHGWWSSNYTHPGSTLKLSCETGYVINGTEFIECKPNVISTNMGQDWDKTIPNCQRATETPKPTSTIGKAPLSEPSLSWLRITIITVSLSSIVAVGVMYLRYGYRKSKDRQQICGGFAKTFPRKRRETRHGDGDDIPLSSNMSTSEKHLHVNSSQVSLNPPEPDRQDEQQSRVKGEDTSVAMLPAVECASVNTDNHDTRDSSTDLIKCGSLTDDVYTDIPTKLTSCVKAHTMKNRPLPDCPKDGLIKPPIPPRKAHTLTRTDQLRNSDTYHKPCTPNDIHSSPTSIRGKTQTTKKAPGGSTPYVKPKSKRYQNNGFPKNKDKNNLEEGTGTESRQHLGGNQVPRSSSDVSPSENISDVPRSQTNQDQDKPSFCGEGMNDESNSRQTAPIVQDVVYCDIEERCRPNTDQVSKGILETEGFNKNEKSSNIQQSCNMYHTLDSTNSNESPVACPEYEDIDNMGRTDSSDFSYDHFNFFNVK